MNHTAFFDSLDKGRIARAYLFSGVEEYVKEEALARLKAKYLPQGLEQLNDTTLEGVTAQKIIETAETMPFMSEKRIVTVRDWAPLLPGAVKDEAAEGQRMTKWLATSPESTVVVFFIRGDPKAKKLQSDLLQIDGVEGVVFLPLSDGEIAQRISSLLHERGHELSPRTARYLIEVSGRNMHTLIGEAEKLAAYAGDRREIRQDDVDKVVLPSAEYRVYTMLDSLIAGRCDEAFRMLRELLLAGEEEIPLLALLERQLYNLAGVSDALMRQEPKELTLSALGIKPFAYDAQARTSRAFAPGDARALYARAVECEFSAKSGALRSRAALEGLMLDIARTAEKQRGTKK